MTTANATPTVDEAIATLGSIADNPIPLADRSDSVVAYWESIQAMGYAGNHVVDNLYDGEIESLFSSSVKSAFAEHLLPALDGTSKTQKILLDLFETQAKAALKGVDKALRKTDTDHALVKRALENCTEDFVQVVTDMAAAAPGLCSALVNGYTTSVTLPGGETGASIIEKSVTGVRATAAERRRTAAASIVATRSANLSQ